MPPPLRFLLLPVAALVGSSVQACSDDVDEGAGQPVVVRHAFGAYALEPGEEIDDLCLSWTLDNEEPLYVQAATLANDGFWHHSNWTVVPDELYAGPDGYWPCRDRGFNQVVAAISGTVLMAQSTQSLFEEQRFPEGLVVKIPARHRIVAGIHFLNTTGTRVETDMRIGLELTHPRNVEGILRPFHLDNRVLFLPPRSERRFRLDCDIAGPFEAALGTPLDLEVRFVLPHFHKRLNAWRLEIVGGPRDGEVVHEEVGFNADANGVAFDPPLSLAGATGLRMTCGYVNESTEPLAWGVGENEMCEMLGLATGSGLVDVGARRTAGGGSAIVSQEELESLTTTVVEDGLETYEADDCSVVAFPPTPAQSLPSVAEVEGVLYVPPTDDPGVDVTPECVDTPNDAEADVPPTLASVARDVFEPSCAHNVCHGGPNPQKGLLLAADPDQAGDLLTLQQRLLDHEVSHGEVDIPLVAPGDPDRSYLYRVLSRCQPGAEWGLDAEVAPKMPVLQPSLLDPERVARIRDWIAAGAHAE